MIELNSGFFPHEDKIVIYDPFYTWDGTNYNGASILALAKLGASKGYSLIYSNGVNLFFLRNDVLNDLEARGHGFNNTNDVKALYKRLENSRIGQDPFNRPYMRSDDL